MAWIKGPTACPVCDTGEWRSFEQKGKDLKKYFTDKELKIYKAEHFDCDLWLYFVECQKCGERFVFELGMPPKKVKGCGRLDGNQRRKGSWKNNAEAERYHRRVQEMHRIVHNVQRSATPPPPPPREQRRRRQRPNRREVTDAAGVTWQVTTH